MKRGVRNFEVKELLRMVDNNFKGSLIANKHI
jgi:hypothetical protein